MDEKLKEQSAQRSLASLASLADAASVVKAEADDKKEIAKAIAEDPEAVAAAAEEARGAVVGSGRPNGDLAGAGERQRVRDATADSAARGARPAA